MSTPSHRSAVGETFAVVGSALRLLWRHWPVLLALGMLAYGARRAVTMAAVYASEVHAVFALLVFALIPAAMLIPMLLMMRVVRRSLPESSPVKMDSSQSAFASIASLLVPFLAIYASYDYFEEDRQTFAYEVWFDEAFNNAEIFNGGQANVLERLPTQLSMMMAIVVGATIVLRLALGAFARNRQPGVALGFTRAYLEATWLSILVLPVFGLKNSTWEWVASRQAVTWVDTGIKSVTDLFGPFSGAANRVVEWLGEILGTADQVLIIPIAWLTIGCVLYGSELVSPPRLEREAAALARWERLNPTLRTMLMPVRNVIDDRFGPMVRGFRLLRHAGLRAMLLFCLAFVAAGSLPEWLWELERFVLGPMDMKTVWIPFSGPLSSINQAIGVMVTICLVTAAVDYVLSLPQPPAEPTSTGDGQPHEAGVGAA